MHGAESSTYSHATPTSTTRLPGATRGGREVDSGRADPVLPEDIGKKTASLLLTEIVKVCQQNCVDTDSSSIEMFVCT